MAGRVDLSLDGALALVTISRPGRLNTMSRDMWQHLRASFEAVHHNREIRCVIVSGDGGNFCAGGDITEYQEFRFSEATLREFHEVDVWGALQAMLDCDVPLVAQIEGACMGAGLEIASCCDLRLAGETARFGAPIAKLGFPMAPREAGLVMRSVGELTAREMLLEAAILDASEMKRRGFLNRVLPDEDMVTAVRAVAVRISRLAPQAARLNKQSLRALASADRTPQSVDLLATAYDYADSEEHREGVRAFIEKRTPQF